MAEASREFDKYLKVTHAGDEFDRAKQRQERDDDGYSNSQLLQTPLPQSGRSSRMEYAASSTPAKRKSKKKEPSPPPSPESEHSSDDDSTD